MEADIAVVEEDFALVHDTSARHVSDRGIDLPNVKHISYSMALQRVEFEACLGRGVAKEFS